MWSGTERICSCSSPEETQQASYGWRLAIWSATKLTKYSDSGPALKVIVPLHGMRLEIWVLLSLRERNRGFSKCSDIWIRWDSHKVHMYIFFPNEVFKITDKNIFISMIQSSLNYFTLKQQLAAMTPFMIFGQIEEWNYEVFESCFFFF